MSELVIITGDCILTFLLRSICEGVATLVRPSVAICECLRSEVRGIFTSASHCFIGLLYVSTLKKQQITLDRTAVNIF